jgi:hypothetical protein
VIGLLVGLACGRFTEFVEGGKAVKTTLASEVLRVEGEAFRLTDEADARLFFALLTHAGTATPGWRVLPFARLGNFVQWRTCSPTVGAAACEGGAVVNDAAPGTAWRELATLTYDAEWPACAGVVYAAGEIPVDGWGATVWLGVNGRAVVGEGFGATAVHATGGRVDRTLRLVRTEVEVGAQVLRLVVGEPRDEALARVSSPENLRATVALRAEALLARVDAALEAEKVTVWREGPYRGGGVPPERTEVAARPAEAEAVTKAARDELVAERDAVAANAAEIHRVLERLLPARLLAP